MLPVARYGYGYGSRPGRGMEMIGKSGFPICGALFISLAYLTFLTCQAQGQGVPPRVGGACEYKHYRGSAKIVSIAPKGDPGGEYEVKFSFDPTNEISEPIAARTEGRDFPLLTRAGQYPTAAFLERNGIEIGKTFECTLDVIVKGTCTPLLFQFPSFSD
jgi:hypothetical protein